MTVQKTLSPYFVNRCIVFCAMAFGIFLILWAALYVPISNDEPNDYHLLACWNHPFSYLDASSVRGCDHRYDLTTPFGFKIERALPYIGILPSLMYAPLYYLWNAPGSLYALGIIFFVGFAYGMGTLAKNKWLGFALSLSLFPFAFQFVHDMSPIKYDILLFPASALLLRRMLRATAARSFLYAAVLGLLFSLAFEEKPFIFYLLPGIALFALAFADDNFTAITAKLRRCWLPLALVVVIFAGFCGLLLLSTLPDGTTYLSYLQNVSSGQGLPPAIYAAGHTSIGEKLFYYLLYWPSYANRYFDIALLDHSGNPRLSFGALLLAIGPPLLLTLSTGLAAWITQRQRDNFQISPRPVLLILSFLSMLGMSYALGISYAPHHFVFMWVPLLILFADILSQADMRWRMALAAIFLAANLIPMIQLDKAQQFYEVSRERDSIRTYFDATRAATAIIDYLSWGDHLDQSLYGPRDQLVTFMQDKSQLFETAKMTNRRIYFVCQIHDPAAFLSIYANSCIPQDIVNEVKAETGEEITVENMMPELKIWHVFGVRDQH